MGNNLLSVLFSQERDVIFEGASIALNSIAALLSLKEGSFEDFDVDEAIFHKVYHNDPNSPSIYALEKDQWLVFYPPNSTPYSHKLKDKCKFVEILSGILYDKNSCRKWFKGDRIKVYPSDNFIPHTKAEKCVIRVCVGDIDSLWDSICK